MVKGMVRLVLLSTTSVRAMHLVWLAARQEEKRAAAEKEKRK